MKLRVLSSLLLLFYLASCLAAHTSEAERFSPPSRTFHFTYKFDVKDIPSSTQCHAPARRQRLGCFHAWTSPLRFSVGSALMDFPTFSWASRRS